MRGWKLEILELDVVLMCLNNTQNPLFIVFSLFFFALFYCFASAVSYTN